MFDDIGESVRKQSLLNCLWGYISPSAMEGNLTTPIQNVSVRNPRPSSSAPGANSFIQPCKDLRTRLFIDVFFHSSALNI